MSRCLDTIEMIAGGTVTLLARAYDGEGNLFTEATTTSGTVNYRDTELTTDTGTDITLNASDAQFIFDTLQTDSIWTEEKDSTGFNFKYVLSNVLTTYNTTYWVEVTLVDTNNNNIKFGWYVKTKGR